MQALTDAINSKVVIHTCFNNRSYFGYKSSQLKSGICKYYRRNEAEKFKWCVFEMLLFGFNTKGKALVTNLLNRLKILLMEDMSVVEIDRTVIGLNKLKEFEDSGRKDYDKIMEFCDVVIGGKKGRLISFSNCWWRNNPDKTMDSEMDTIELNKVNKYKKKGDSELLLKLGEKLIGYLETNDERIMDIFNRMKITESAGTRYRRKDALYLFMEITQDYCDNDKLKKIHSFVLEMMFRKNMKERYSFGIWLGVILWKKNDIDFSSTNLDTEFDSSNNCNNIFINYFKDREHLELDDYVVKDYHVNKKYGLEKFAKIGSFVENEDYGIIGYDKYILYKEFYIKSKMDQDKDTSKNTTSKKKKPKFIVKKQETIETIDFDNFTVIKVLEEGVCCGKMCCIKINYNGKDYILKEMGKGMNYGKDYIFVDSLKGQFNLIDLNMSRIKSNKGLVKKDSKKPRFVGNWEIKDKECIYCIMDYYENIGDLGKHKELLESPILKKELFKIRLFDGLFRSSDNILRNILVSQNKLVSIDENDIYGKRANIFNKNDWCKKNSDKKMIDEILEEFDLTSKIELVKSRMPKYGFEDKIDEMVERFGNYKKIVYGELGHD